MWKSLIGKAKEGGIDVIQTYVFWNLHEPKQGQVCHYKNLTLCLLTSYKNIFTKYV